jgi:hypothetical protein
MDGITLVNSEILESCKQRLHFTINLRNNDSKISAVNLRAKLIGLDTLLGTIPVIDFSFSDIDPLGIATSSNAYSIDISDECHVGTAIPVKVEVSSDFL